jgi:peroxiredoxin
MEIPMSVGGSGIFALQMLRLGDEAPRFESLLGVDGKRYSLSSFQDKPFLVVIFSCNHCPYAQAYEERMIAIQRDYHAVGAQLVVINSNDSRRYPEDSYSEMVKRARMRGFNFPYIRDEDQSVVAAYGGVCTPHVFLFGRPRFLRYRGRIDDSKDAAAVKENDLRNALDDLIANRSVGVPDTRPFGCSIKWSEGP